MSSLSSAIPPTTAGPSSARPRSNALASVRNSWPPNVSSMAKSSIRRSMSVPSSPPPRSFSIARSSPRPCYLISRYPSPATASANSSLASMSASGRTIRPSSPSSFRSRRRSGPTPSPTALAPNPSYRFARPNQPGFAPSSRPWPGPFKTIHLIIDATGESTLIEVLRRDRSLDAYPLRPVAITGGYHTSRLSGGYQGIPRPDLLTRLRTAFQTGRLSLPAAPGLAELESELVAFRTDGHQSSHDDLVFALALSVWLAYEQQKDHLLPVPRLR